ncbi:MAG: AAA family ATPase [Myxococcaceae bacterium]
MTRDLVVTRIVAERVGRFERLECSLRAGLNVIYGVNEAGKSTLLELIRDVPFGFERTRAKLRPGAVGELSVESDGQAYVLRRSKGRGARGDFTARTEAGESLPEGLLETLLGGVQRGAFEEVFAFGLDALGSFESLAQQSSVTHALFAAGTHGARHVPSALKRLREDADNIYAPRGTKPALNVVLQKLSEARAKIAQWGDRPAEYARALERVTALEEETCALTEKRGLLERDASRHRRWLSAAPLVREALAAERIAAQAGEAPPLPPEVWPRAKALDQRTRELADEINTLKTEASGIDALLAEAGERPDERPLGELARRVSESVALAQSLHEREVQLGFQQKRWVMDREAAGLAGPLESWVVRPERAIESARLERLVQEQDALKRERVRAEGVHEAAQQAWVSAKRLVEERRAVGAAVLSRRKSSPANGLLAGVFAVCALLVLGALTDALRPPWVFAAVAGVASALAAAWELSRRQRERLVQSIQEARLAEAEQALEESETARSKAEAEVARVSDARAQWAQAWSGVLTSLEFADTVLPEDGRMLLRVSASLATRARDLDAAAQTIAQERQRQAAVVQALREGLLALGRSVLGDADTVLRVWNEVQAVGEERRAQQRAWTERRRALEARCATQQNTFSASEASLQALLKSAACDTIESLEQRARVQEEIQRARQRALEKRAHAEAATGVAWDELRTALGRPDAEERALAHQRDAERALSEATATLQGRAEEKGGLVRLLEQWASDDALADARREEEVLVERAATLGRDYLVDRIAEALILEARAEYDRRAQPKLMVRASRYASKLTEGRYTLVLPPDETSSELRVLDATGKAWAADALSRGTREQLYLAFRFALVEDFAERGVALPLVVDDVCVNFDDARGEAVAAVLRELSLRHQVVVFTCHARVRESLARQQAFVTQLPEPADITVAPGQLDWVAR